MNAHFLQFGVSNNHSACSNPGHDVPEVRWFALSRKTLISPVSNKQYCSSPSGAADAAGSADEIVKIILPHTFVTQFLSQLVHLLTNSIGSPQ